MDSELNSVGYNCLRSFGGLGNQEVLRTLEKYYLVTLAVITQGGPWRNEITI